MTRRNFIKLFTIGFVSAIAGNLESGDNDDDDGGER